MTAESNFIGKVKAYFGSDAIGESGEKRISMYLNEYRSELEPITILKDKIVEKIVFIDKGSGKIIHPEITSNVLVEEAMEICKEQGLPFELFLSRKRTREIVDVKKAFVRYIYSKYSITGNQLSDFLRCHHTTICFYKNGRNINSRYKKKKLPKTIS